jgi:Ser/Thr protein kinase RdoA (MazF antagonist)
MISPLLCQILNKRYGLARIHGASLLDGGERNRVLRLECEQGIFVLRVSPPGVPAGSIAYEHALMRFMHGELPQVPRPLAGCDGSTWFRYRGRLATIFPCMPGRMADRESARVRREAARVLARIHRAALDYPDRSPRPGYPSLRDLDWGENHAWSWPAVRAFLSQGAGGPGGAMEVEPPEVTAAYKREIVDRLPQIEWEREAMLRWLAQLAGSGRALQFAPIHGDYYRRNLLVEGDAITAVLDWDECRPEWLALELGRAMWEFCKCKRTHSLPGTRACAFLQAYQEAGGPVSAAEFDLLVSSIRCTRLVEALSDLGKAARDEVWDAGYTLHNLIAMENLRSIDFVEG